MKHADPITQTAKDAYDTDYFFPYQRLVNSNIFEAAEAPDPVLKRRQNTISGKKEIPETKPNRIIILSTHAGKSLCFMLPSLLLTRAILVVFPSSLHKQTRHST